MQGLRGDTGTLPVMGGGGGASYLAANTHIYITLVCACVCFGTTMAAFHLYLLHTLTPCEHTLCKQDHSLVVLNCLSIACSSAAFNNVCAHVCLFVYLLAVH